MNEQLARFSTTLDKNNWNEAMKIRKQILKDSKMQDLKLDEPKINLNTVNIFKK